MEIRLRNELGLSIAWTLCCFIYKLGRITLPGLLLDKLNRGDISNSVVWESLGHVWGSVGSRCLALPLGWQRRPLQRERPLHCVLPEGRAQCSSRHHCYLTSQERRLSSVFPYSLTVPGASHRCNLSSMDSKVIHTSCTLSSLALIKHNLSSHCLGSYLVKHGAIHSEDQNHPGSAKSSKPAFSQAKKTVHSLPTLYLSWLH